MVRPDLFLKSKASAADSVKALLPGIFEKNAHPKFLYDEITQKSPDGLTVLRHEFIVKEDLQAPYDEAKAALTDEGAQSPSDQQIVERMLDNKVSGLAAAIQREAYFTDRSAEAFAEWRDEFSSSKAKQFLEVLLDNILTRSTNGLRLDTTLVDDQRKPREICEGFSKQVEANRRARIYTLGYKLSNEHSEYGIIANDVRHAVYEFLKKPETCEAMIDSLIKQGKADETVSRSFHLPTDITWDSFKDDLIASYRKPQTQVGGGG